MVPDRLGEVTLAHVDCCRGAKAAGYLKPLLIQIERYKRRGRPRSGGSDDERPDPTYADDRAAVRQATAADGVKGYGEWLGHGGRFVRYSIGNPLADERGNGNLFREPAIRVQSKRVVVGTQIRAPCAAPGTLAAPDT